MGTIIKLNTRGMNFDPTCQRCCMSEETINHCLLTCPFATMIWRLSNIPALPLQTLSENVEDNISSILNLQQTPNINREQKLLPIWLV